MDRIKAQYRRLLASLLPTGKAWSIEPQSVLDRVLNGLADECGQIHSEIAAIIGLLVLSESDEVLTRWETLLGLKTKAQSLNERRSRVAFWLSPPGSLSRAAFEKYLRIEGFKSFEIEDNSIASDGAITIGEEDTDNYFKITLKTKDKVSVQKEFEELVQRVKPAHVKAEISYQEPTND